MTLRDRFRDALDYVTCYLMALCRETELRRN
jgi:hypothetical protein